MTEHDQPRTIQELADDLGAKVHEVQRLPDGSGFAVMSLPLPKDHWLTRPGANVPPMPFQLGTHEFITITTRSSSGLFTREELAEKIREAGHYAVRAATLNGTEMDFDPDALIQNLVVGLLGYWTPTGLSADEGANPKKETTHEMGRRTGPGGAQAGPDESPRP
jgi:hypothetical protein